MYLADLTPPISAGKAWVSGFINVSVADVIIIVLMIVVFILAVSIPLSGGKK